jgi:hypothetical protein
MSKIKKILDSSEYAELHSLLSSLVRGGPEYQHLQERTVRAALPCGRSIRRHCQSIKACGWMWQLAL